MSNTINNHALLNLVREMTKAEKRHFTLYSKRNNKSKDDFQFLLLFNVIDRYQRFDQSAIEKNLPGITAKKLSDLKRHLYEQLLESLRLFNSKKDEFKLASQIEYARILYNKGMFIDSLDLLHKVKISARSAQKHLLLYEIIDFEKEIESRHVTRSHASRAQELEAENNEIRGIIRAEADWSELALNMYAKFLQIGHVKNQEEFTSVNHFFEAQKNRIKTVKGKRFFEELYRYQSYVWYNYIVLHFAEGYRYSLRWVQLFEVFPSFVKSHPHLLIKGIHNCLSVLFYCMDVKRHNYQLEQLEKILLTEGPAFNRNTQVMSFVYLNTARLNNIVLTGRFSESQTYLKSLEKELLFLNQNIDNHRLMVFWYKMASIYFTMGDHRQCVRLLNEIINPQQSNLREDVQCFARLLNLIAHFELENDDLLGHLVQSTYRFLLKMNEKLEMHDLIIRFLRTALFKDRKSLKSDFKALKTGLEKLSAKQFERRLLLYLDIISWLESKIDHVEVEQIILAKRQKRQPDVLWIKNGLNN